jgi:hypothetical protein
LTVNSAAVSAGVSPIPIAAAWAGADQDQLAGQVGTLDGDLLGDQPAHRVPDQVDGRQVQRVDERGGVRGHPLDRVRDDAAAGGDAGVVEQDDLAVGGEGVADGRVVVVEVSDEVLEEHERDAPALRVAEAAVGEADAVGLDEPGGGGVVGVVVHEGRATSLDHVDRSVDRALARVVAAAGRPTR